MREKKTITDPDLSKALDSVNHVNQAGQGSFSLLSV